VEKYFVTVAGNIGAGKTTLTNVLAKHFSWHPFYESADGNPYLSNFYHDMEKWAFHSQIYFLIQKVKASHNISKYDKSIIVDRTFYEDGEIFAKNLYEIGKINDTDYGTYMELYNLLTNVLPKPDIMIYMQADVDFLYNRITDRSRNYENSISKEYLSQLNKYYEDWIKRYKESKLLIINPKEYDYLNNNEHLNSIAEQIKKIVGM
jgi:deoxyadenosine/deoxycytidine kinase